MSCKIIQATNLRKHSSVTKTINKQLLNCVFSNPRHYFHLIVYILNNFIWIYDITSLDLISLNFGNPGYLCIQWFEANMRMIIKSLLLWIMLTWIQPLKTFQRLINWVWRQRYLPITKLINNLFLIMDQNVQTVVFLITFIVVYGPILGWCVFP